MERTLPGGKWKYGQQKYRNDRANTRTRRNTSTNDEKIEESINKF